MSRDPEYDPHFRDPAVPLSSEQLELRKRTLKEIGADELTFDMHSWEGHGAVYQDVNGTWGCNTTRCVAGWAQFIARGKVTYGLNDGPDVETDAIGLLGLTEDEFYHGDPEGLFYLPDDVALKRLRALAEEEA